MSNVVAFRRFNVNPDQEIRSLHGSFVPGDVYETTPIRVSVTFVTEQGRLVETLNVYRISPLGVEIDLTKASRTFRELIQPNLEIDATLKIGNQDCEFRGLVVATRHVEGDKELFGVRWCRLPTTGQVTADRRKSKRWLCGDEFLPTGTAPNPTRFNDFLMFRVLDISSKGMQLATSMRNKYLVPGMRLEATVTFPMVAPVELFLKVINARIAQKSSGEDYLSLGVQFLDPDVRALETVGQYVLQFGPQSTAAELKQEGLPIRQVTSALDFSFVKSTDDYRQVLALRQAAYGACGKMDPFKPLESAGDMFDTRAKILMARHRGKLVGSVRIMYHDPEDPTEHEQFTSLPDSFPRKDEMVEVTRVCTDPDYRGADLFYGLMKHMMLTIAQSKRRWLLGSASSKLMPLYKKIGFSPTGHFYKHADLGNEAHELLLGDIPKILSGVGVGPAIWNELYADVSDYLRDQHGYEFDPLLNVRMGVYRAMGPLTRLFTGGIRNPGKGR